jgi:PEP-CTERM putative exosortase interaction domain
MHKRFLFAGIVRLLISGFCALAFCLLSPVAWADSIPVQNASFELVANPPGLNQACAGTGCAFNDVANGPIPNWTPSFNASAGSFQPGSTTTYFNTALPDGNIVAYINNGSISQTLGVSVLPDSIYTLSVDVGRRNDVLGVNYSLNLLDGSNAFCTQSGSNSTIATGTFSEITLTCTTGASVPAGLLGIELTGAGRQVDFDNVQLSVTTAAVATPEPGTLALTFVSLLVGGLLFVRSRRNQSLQSATS